MNLFGFTSQSREQVASLCEAEAIVRDTPDKWNLK